jgi:hypothetical protein
MSLGSPAGFSALGSNPARSAGGLNFGIGPSAMMAVGQSPNLNFAAQSGMFGGLGTSAFAPGTGGFGGFANVFGAATMSGPAAGPMIWNDGFNNGFSMGVMSAQSGGLASRNNRNIGAVGNDPTEPDTALMTAAQARRATNANVLRTRTTPKRSKPRAKSVRSLTSAR